MPYVSIIIPAYYSADLIEACLYSLQKQTFQNFEVIVVDSTPDGATANLLEARYPNIHAVRSSQRLLPYAARNRGVMEATGDILVFTDPDCVAYPDWLEVLVAAHSQGHKIVGGAIACANTYRDWGIHLAKFVWWLPGGQARACADIPTANSSYARSVWQQIGPFVEHRMCADTELNWRMQAAGQPIWFEPRAVVIHQHTTTLWQAMCERFGRGHDYAAARINHAHWHLRTFLYLVAFPAIPWVIIMRSAYSTLRAGYFRRWLLTAPVHVLCTIGWACGEAKAYVQAMFGNLPGHFLST